MPFIVFIGSVIPGYSIELNYQKQKLSHSLKQWKKFQWYQLGNWQKEQE